MILLIVSVLLLLPYSLLILFYRKSWLDLSIYNLPAMLKATPSTFISIIIPARNEEENIGRCIDSIINQSFPEQLFELIVIDDNSTDNTAATVSLYNNKNIRLIKINDFIKNEVINSYKKKALEVAIGLARGSLIVTTDADCTFGPEWLLTIASFYEQSNFVCVAAPVAFNNFLQTDSFFNKFLNIFQSLDFMMLQGITGASVHKKIHSMCNGANFIYEKKVFYEAGGFEGIDNIASGDDMLLMHKIKKIYPDRVGFLKSPNAIAQTQPAKSGREFLNQRVRWASKADRYPDIKITSVLFLVYFTNAWIFFLGIYSFFYVKAWYLFLLLLIMKTSIELVFLFPVASFFNKKKILRWFFPAQPFHIVYTLIAGWLGKFGSYTWKDRKVK